MKPRDARLTRRQTIGLAGLAGAGYVAGRAVGIGDGSTPDGLGADPAGAATCVVAPEVTEGPFWEDEKLERSDVTGGQSGVPLALKITIVDLDDNCSAYEGAWVDIWHANADGNYSDEPAGMGNDNTLGQTWLRGYQVTNASGVVDFQTIWPGFYTGRACHIHVRVRTFDGNSNTTTNAVTQLFFNEDKNSTVFATSAYNTGSRTTNAQDSIYAEEQQQGNLLLLDPSGSVGNGYSTEATIALTGLPAGTSNDTKVDATLKKAKFTERTGERQLELKLDADETVNAKAKLLRGGKTIAHKNIDGLAAGTPKLAIPIREKVEGGGAKLELTLVDKTGNKKTIKKNVDVPG
jgi:protocatechuate 3,4-dioxygenase beta subunit